MDVFPVASICSLDANPSSLVVVSFPFSLLVTVADGAFGDVLSTLPASFHFLAPGTVSIDPAGESCPSSFDTRLDRGAWSSVFKLLRRLSGHI
jgi:hypothetical protein